MTETNEKALYDYLVAEYNHPFDYWDWSYLAGRRVEVPGEPKGWHYTEDVKTAMKQASSVLDMRTGSGEIFAQMLKQQPVPQAYATEGYAPDLIHARQTLEPLGVTVYEVHDERLPFADDTLELIANRHGGYDPREVLRVLKPGHLFITQQVGNQTNLRLHEVLGSQKRKYLDEDEKQNPVRDLASAVREMHDTGWHLVEQREHFSITRFYDTGAIVYYLKAIPWEVPDFSIDKYFDKLVTIHHLIERDGYLDVPFHAFFMIARKPH